MYCVKYFRISLLGVAKAIDTVCEKGYLASIKSYVGIPRMY